MNIMETITIIVIPLALGIVTSVIATFITNKIISSEEIIKRRIMRIIKTSLRACGNPSNLLDFDAKKFRKTIVVWQEYKNELIRKINNSQNADIKIKIEPKMFLMNKGNSFNDEKLKAYNMFCDIFIHNFSDVFSMDSEYIISSRQQEVVNVDKKQSMGGQVMMLRGLFKRISERRQKNKINQISKSLYEIASKKLSLHLFDEALEYSYAALEAETNDTVIRADVLVLISLVYSAMGHYQEELSKLNEALSIREKTLGKEHPSTATTYNNIASVYDNQGDHTKALEWYNKASGIFEKMLGEKHPFTITTRNNIDITTKKQKSQEE
ncbi:MAG: tetratricopeptide repeat protein [Defluviitaleaceae bacterium]|nr:tetratricopeptide repeat protein [Defluviitaleaceae bacterium]